MAAQPQAEGSSDAAALPKLPFPDFWHGRWSFFVSGMDEKKSAKLVSPKASE